MANDSQPFPEAPNAATGRLRQLEGEIRVLLAEVGRTVGAPPLPDEYVSNLAGQPKGWTWRPADGWSVQVCSDGPERNGVYVHTPADSFAGDVTPLWPEEARSLAAALLAAADAVDAAHLIPTLGLTPERPVPATTTTPHDRWRR